MDYANGKIYKILNTVDDSCYIGSTTQALSKRMVWHRDALRNPKVNHRLLYTKMTEHCVDNFFIELIEDCPCENVEQLRKREGELIRQFGTLNKKIEGRSKKEYSQLYELEHKEHLNELRKGYKERDRDRILERRKELRLESIDKRREQDNTYYENNKEKIYERTKDWKSSKTVCECGGCYTNAHKGGHLKSKKHITFVEQSVD